MIIKKKEYKKIVKELEEVSRRLEQEEDRADTYEVALKEVASESKIMMEKYTSLLNDYNDLQEEQFNTGAELIRLRVAYDNKSEECGCLYFRQEKYDEAIALIKELKECMNSAFNILDTI